MFYNAERHKMYAFCRAEEQSSIYPHAARSSQTLRPGGWMWGGCRGVGRVGECKGGWESVIYLQKKIAIHVVSYFKYLELFIFRGFLCLYNCIFMSLPHKRLTLEV